MERFFWICLAGAFGTGARYLVCFWAGTRFGNAFPYGTLIVNVVGCFCIAVVAQAAASLAAFPPTLRFVLMTGFIGGLTTYSSFGYETITLAQEGTRGTAFLNFALTTGACFIAVLLGQAIVRAIIRS